MSIELDNFSKKELANDFYDSFLNLIKHGFLTEACLLMLSTWNFARFRYALRSFNLKRFSKALKSVNLTVSKFSDDELGTMNLDNYREEIKRAFNMLNSIKGVEKTGAPKLMHIMAPKVFVMWDGYIRKFYEFKNGDSNDYFNFLKDMQTKFRDAKFRFKSKRTLAKIIDEHNYKSITEKALRKF